MFSETHGTRLSPAGLRKICMIRQVVPVLGTPQLYGAVLRVKILAAAVALALKANDDLPKKGADFIASIKVLGACHFGAGI
jgi:hypothetical protein